MQPAWHAHQMSLQQLYSQYNFLIIFPTSSVGMFEMQKWERAARVKFGLGVSVRALRVMLLERLSVAEQLRLC